MPRKHIATILLVVIWNSPCAYANYEAAKSANDSSELIPFFGVFDTAGVALSGAELAEFTSSIFNANGGGFTHSCNTDVDIKLRTEVIANATAQRSSGAMTNWQPGFSQVASSNLSVARSIFVL